MVANRDPVMSLLGPELEKGLTGLQNELIGVAGAEFGKIVEGLPNAGGTRVVFQGRMGCVRWLKAALVIGTVWPQVGKALAPVADVLF